MAGPEDRERPQPPESSEAPPPGHFLSADLESDCARFLEEMRALVRRREQEAARVSPRL